MTTYYVATLAHYVLVDAPTADEARVRAVPLLEQLLEQLRGGPGRFPVAVRTVRPATADEIELMRFDARMRAGG
jgi:hypothetical protein